MNLKQQLVVKNTYDEFEIWSKKQYDEYIAGCVEYGAGSAYRIVTHFNEDENLLKDSPYQGSAGTWVKASERLPQYPDDPGNHYRLNGRKVHGNFFTDEEGMTFFSVRGFTHETYLIGKPSFVHLEWLDESAASPAGDGWVSELVNALEWYADAGNYLTEDGELATAWKTNENIAKKAKELLSKIKSNQL